MGGAEEGDHRRGLGEGKGKGKDEGQGGVIEATTGGWWR